MTSLNLVLLRNYWQFSITGVSNYPNCVRLLTIYITHRWPGRSVGPITSGNKRQLVGVLFRSRFRFAKTNFVSQKKALTQKNYGLKNQFGLQSKSWTE